MLIALGPEVRMIPMAPPLAVDMAQMVSFKILLHENKVNGSDEADEGCKVIPVETFVLEHQMCDDGEYQQGNTLLNHF